MHWHQHSNRILPSDVHRTHILDDRELTDLRWQAMQCLHYNGSWRYPATVTQGGSQHYFHLQSFVQNHSLQHFYSCNNNHYRLQIRTLYAGYKQSCLLYFIKWKLQTLLCNSLSISTVLTIPKILEMLWQCYHWPDSLPVAQLTASKHWEMNPKKRQKKLVTFAASDESYASDWKSFTESAWEDGPQWRLNNRFLVFLLNHWYGPHSPV